MRSFTKACTGFLLMMAASSPGPATAQPEDAHETASTVEILVDVYARNGRPPLDLTADDLEVREAGELVEVLGVRPLAGADGLAARRRDELTRPLEVPWRVLVYFDSALIAHPSRVEAAVLLADAAPYLTALGSVQVVSADPAPRIRLDWTRDPKLVRSALRGFALTATGGADLVKLRGQFRQERAGAFPIEDEAGLDRRRERWTTYVEAENALVESRLELLRGWLAREPADTPSALLWICGGFDLDPGVFYLRDVPDGDLRSVLERELRAHDPGLGFDELVRVVQRPPWLWTVVPVALKESAEPPESVTETLFDDPGAPLATIALETGGLVMEDRVDLQEVLRSLGRRFAVTYPLDPAAAGERRPLEVRSRRPNLETRAVRRLNVPDPAEVDWTRAMALLPHRLDLDALPPLADPRPVYLSPLGRATVVGRVLVEAQAVAADVAQVAFWLDDELAATVTKPPFEAWLRLPKLPEPRTLRAVALDRDGRELGADTLRVNQGLDTFDVTLRRLPDASGANPIDVEVDVRAPFRRSVLHVELYWDGELRTTLAHPPYRHRFPVANATGSYLRAVATLDDGTLGEDVLLLGQEGFKSEVEVELVELYTVVRDRKGTLVGSLEEKDFEIREDGLVQTVKSFQHPLETPLTLGLVVDISKSIGDDLPLVQRAARNFVRRILEPGDRGFLMAFDHKVYLLQQQTDDLELLERSIDVLRPGHGTSIYDAMITGLLNLRSVHGRRSLVVLTDGVDEHSRHDFDQTLELAKRSGVPLYVIGMGDFGDYSHHRKMTRLARVTGADLHVIKKAEQLGDAYHAIAEELDGQYLLTYESSQPSDKEGWREVELEVARPGLDVRTIDGYFVR